jgi:hypothetical protein
MSTTSLGLARVWGTHQCNKDMAWHLHVQKTISMFVLQRLWQCSKRFNHMYTIDGIIRIPMVSTLVVFVVGIYSTLWQAIHNIDTEWHGQTPSSVLSEITWHSISTATASRLGYHARCQELGNRRHKLVNDISKHLNGIRVSFLQLYCMAPAPKW